MRKKIAVFASAAIKEGSPVYDGAVDAGRIIGKKLDVICGGYGGLMEAVCRGASEAGASCYGIGLKRFGPGHNRYISEMKLASTLAERLEYFMKNSCAFIALPGGIGTLCEVMFIWDNMKAGLLPSKPIFLYGKLWGDFLSVLKKNFIISERAMRLVRRGSTRQSLKNFLDSV